jgi:hypothetical protein
MKIGIIFLYEGLLRYENVFRDENNTFHVQSIIRRLEKIERNVKEIGIPKEHFDSVYESLLKISF